jgi:hypothetical protein
VIAEPAGDRAQHLIPGCVAVAVVDRLKVVNVDDRYGKRTAGLARERSRDGQRLGARTPVRQSGQHVNLSCLREHAIALDQLIEVRSLTQRTTYPGQQLGGTRRLGDEVSRARIQHGGNGCLALIRCQDQHRRRRNLAVRPQPSEHLLAAKPRQPEVEDQQIGTDDSTEIQRDASVLRLVHIETFATKQVDEVGALRGRSLCHQHARAWELHNIEIDASAPDLSPRRCHSSEPLP